MFQRITAALSALVKPIASSQSEDLRTGQKNQSGEFFQRSRPKEAKITKAIPANQPMSKGSSNDNEKLDPSSDIPISKGYKNFATDSFLGVKTAFEICKSKMISCLAAKSYWKTSNTSKKKQKIRKGIIYDENVE